jgi:hypothetical protein
LSALRDGFSHIYPTLRDLRLVLCDIAENQDAPRVTFLLEPSELELIVARQDGHVHVSMIRFPDRRRSVEGEPAFSYVGPTTGVRAWLTSD